MTLNGRKVTLVEIIQCYGANRKNFNDDRPMLSAAKCRPVVLVLVYVFFTLTLAYFHIKGARASVIFSSCSSVCESSGDKQIDKIVGRLSNNRVTVTESLSHSECIESCRELFVQYQLFPLSSGRCSALTVGLG